MLCFKPLLGRKNGICHTSLILFSLFLLYFYFKIFSFSHVLLFSWMTSFGLKCWSDKIKGKGSSSRSWDTIFPHLHFIKICPLGGIGESITQIITFFHAVTQFLPTALLSKHAPMKDDHCGFYLYLDLKQFQQENYCRFIITRYFYAPPLSDTHKKRD